MEKFWGNIPTYACKVLSTVLGTQKMLNKFIK